MCLGCLVVSGLRWSVRVDTVLVGCLSLPLLSTKEGLMAFPLKSALQIVDSLLQLETNVSLHSVPLLWNLWKLRNAAVAGVPVSSACCGLHFSPALGASKLVSCVLITGLSHLKIS